MAEQKICTQCGYIGKYKKKAKGSFITECGVWFLGLLTSLFFGVVGVIVLLFALLYSLWRLVAGSYYICPSCKNKDCMIPTSTPRGQQLAEEFRKINEHKN